VLSVNVENQVKKKFTNQQIKKQQITPILHIESLLYILSCGSRVITSYSLRLQTMNNVKLNNIGRAIYNKKIVSQ